MNANNKARLDRLVTIFRPPTCYSPGPTCDKVRLVGDGSLAPPIPTLPERCAGCRRPIRWQIVELVGVDVERI